MEKAELEQCFGDQGGLEMLCDLKGLGWPKERFSELSTNINLGKIKKKKTQLWSNNCFL